MFTKISLINKSFIDESLIDQKGWAECMLEYFSPVLLLKELLLFLAVKARLIGSSKSLAFKPDVPPNIFNAWENLQLMMSRVTTLCVCNSIAKVKGTGGQMKNASTFSLRLLDCYGTAGQIIIRIFIYLYGRPTQSRTFFSGNKCLNPFLIQRRKEINSNFFYY